MRDLKAFGALWLLAGAACAQTGPPEQPWWTPDAALIARLEAGLRINPGSLPGYTSSITYPIAQYNRYYAGVTVGGRRWIRGVLLLPPNREDKLETGVHVTDRTWLPPLPPGGGCAHVTVIYQVDKDVSSATCALLGTGVPPSERPHWEPDEQTAAHLERLLRERMQRARLPDLATYDRFYRGVTIDGRRLIRGRVLYTSEEARQRAGLGPPAVHRSSEDSGRFMADGACNNISLTYDVNAARFTELRCDGMGFGVLDPDR